MVTISLGMTLEAALLETVHATEHRSVGEVRIACSMLQETATDRESS